MTDPPKVFPLAHEQLEAIKKMLADEQTHDRYHYSHDLVSSTLHSVLQHKRELVAGNLSRTREFQQDVLTFMRAFSLMLESVGGAATHGEKAARLRGLIEMVESAARKLRDWQFREISLWGGGISEDVFRSDYPVRHYIDKTREAEARVKQLEDEIEAMKERGLV